MTLYIENYYNKSDYAGYRVTDITHAALFATSLYQYGIKNACGILTECGKKYKFTLKNEDGVVIANKNKIKKIAKILIS